MRAMAAAPAEAAAPSPALSIVLPVYNAMPWVPITVRDMLKQVLPGGASLELLCAFDGGSDGSLTFLNELVALLGPSQASFEVCAPPPAGTSAAVAAAGVDRTDSGNGAGVDRAIGTSATAGQRDGPADAAAATDFSSRPPAKRTRAEEPAAGGGVPVNPAMLQALRASEIEDHPSFKPEQAPAEQRQLSAAEVAAAARPEHRLRVLAYSDRINRGQGAAMSLALSRARAELIGQMESDDERCVLRRLTRTARRRPAGLGGPT
eukprot:SAG11_NODE_4077_length_2075_cov_3.279352_1_plen_263_part_00